MRAPAGVYDYVVEGPFVDHVGAIADAIGRLRSQNLTEGAADARNRARRDPELLGLATNLASLYGELEGLGAVLPQPEASSSAWAMTRTGSRVSAGRG